MNDKIISIIIPVYNTEKDYLRKCLEPFLLNEDPRIEIVVVDDGSNSETAALLSNMTFGCVNQLKIVHRANGGQNAARNTGINEAIGEYIEFLDSDDYIDWNSQLEIIRVLEIYHPDLLSFRAQQMSASGKTICTWGPVAEGEAYREISKSEMLMECSSLWMQIYKRSIFRQYEINLIESIYIGEDIAAVVPLILASKTLGVVDSILYHFVERPTSVTHKVNTNRLLDILKAFESIISWMNQNANICEFDYKESMSLVERLAIKHVCFAGIARAVEWDGPCSTAIPKLLSWMELHFPNWRNNSLFKSDPTMHHLNYYLILNGYYRTYLLFLKTKRKIKCLFFR
ncbi:glycosyltransferase family 2 protein [Collinsella tanakaei]|uniref:glycosyltransferase family 2 protein n=1 Tax=Collinsella tanakaei TaxID=626935 RepID=UPI00195675AD|nr:glycosyltransferase family 2 protein [Collinsella tanakaei]MBM6868108.1 glycosyltransferase family 2 protein [Collinsella tanakaei]